MLATIAYNQDMTGGERFMAQQPQRIEFDDFAGNLDEVFKQVRDRNQPVLVERDGEMYRLERDTPEDIWRGYDPDLVKKAIAASAGALRGVDIETLLEDL